jgi:hypothetical protein
LVEKAEKSLKDGYSVAILVHDNPSLITLADKLKTNCRVSSSQSTEDNDRSIRNFENRDSRIIIFNHQSLSQGISLHDTFQRQRRVYR